MERWSSNEVHLFVSVFNSALSYVCHIAMRGRMIMKDELVRMWKEVAMVSFEVL
jgi:hypothetical protein